MTLELLQAELAAMPDWRDVPLRQLYDYEAKRRAIQTRINIIRSAESTLAELAPQIADLTKWHDHLVEWRKTLSDQLVACPQLQQQSVRLSIICIDKGLDFANECYPARLPLDDLMAAAGYEPDGKTLAMSCGACWRGSLPGVEARLKELTRRGDEAQVRLDATLREPSASPITGPAEGTERNEPVSAT